MPLGTGAEQAFFAHQHQSGTARLAKSLDGASEAERLSTIAEG